jgi:hypothetical protein
MEISPVSTAGASTSVVGLRIRKKKMKELRLFHLHCGCNFKSIVEACPSIWKSRKRSECVYLSAQMYGDVNAVPRGIPGKANHMFPVTGYQVSVPPPFFGLALLPFKLGMHRKRGEIAFASMKKSVENTR